MLNVNESNVCKILNKIIAHELAGVANIHHGNPNA